MNESMRRRISTDKHRVDRTLAGEVIDPARSALMSRVRAKNTKPEIVVRRLAHVLGYRFRLHRSDLPGTPDLVFPWSRKVIFVHGCFWHRHRGCSRTTTPKTRVAYWKEKFKQNTKRDISKEHALKSLGWDILVVWECETFDSDKLSDRIATFLDRRNRSIKSRKEIPTKRLRAS